jgi:two-component sensor histidine kinase
MFLLYIMKRQRDRYALSIEKLQHHHQNSIQTIIGLLDMQVFRMADVECKGKFVSHVERIKSINSVSERLYNKIDSNRIDIEPICREIIHHLQSSTDAVIDFEIDSVELDIKSINSIGLILNEAISNATRYGGDSVEVRFEQVGDRCRLYITDNGVGFDRDNIDEGLGLILIDSLSYSLPSGDISITSSDSGTEIKVEFIWEER